MGSRFDITVVANSQENGDRYLQMAIGEITRIEKIISSWDPQSETSEINRNAGIRPVAVSKELFQLIVRACAVSKLTKGAFDISYASMDAVWKFDGTMTDETLSSTDKSFCKKCRFSKHRIEHRKKQCLPKE